jgi:hypothetical protein
VPSPLPSRLPAGDAAAVLRRGGMALGEAMHHNTALAGLLARAQASRQRLDAVRPLLPPELRPAVRAGPLDDTGWSLLADGSASAAKLRQLLPRLAQALADAGWPDLPLRVKVVPRGGTGHLG